jgi:hypothetical protein
VSRVVVGKDFEKEYSEIVEKVDSLQKDLSLAESANYLYSKYIKLMSKRLILNTKQMLNSSEFRYNFSSSLNL